MLSSKHLRKNSEVVQVLGVDTSEFDIAVLVALGTNAGNIPHKKRLDFEEVVVYV